MDTINTYKPPPKIARGSKGSLLDWITQSESLVIFGGFFVVIMATVVFAGIFQASDSYRPNLLYNAFGALLMAGGFIYIIFAFMGKQVIILGEKIDVGMIIYITIVLFIMFVFGN